MKILIYGAGVIGSLYAVRFANAGMDVDVYARGQRLRFLRENGLLYREKGVVRRANVEILSAVMPGTCYDLILLSVRENQLHAALRELKTQASPTIVTMVNTLEACEDLEADCGAGRILPAFPGAGGSIADGILDASLTPALVQPTTFGEPGGRKTERARLFRELLRKSGIPYQEVKDMHSWQLSHLGMVVPLADAYYASDRPEQVYLDSEIMRGTAAALRENFRKLARRGQLSPRKFYLILPLPISLLAWILGQVYKSGFGDRFMYQHAMKAPEEMAELHRVFYDHMER